MKKLAAFLRWAALSLAALTVGAWLLSGAHPGWSRTSVPVDKTDEVTGLTYREYERRFVPGIEVLAGGLVLAAGLGLAGWMLARSRPTDTPPPGT